MTKARAELSLAAGLEAAMTAAGAQARARRQALTLEHFLAVIARDEAGAELLRACGADPAELVRELDEYLELLAERSRRDPLADPLLERALSRAALHAVASGQPTLGVGAVLVTLIAEREAYAAMLLHAQGVDPLDVLRGVAHGRRAPDPAPAEGAVLAVRFHNDDYTTMEFVVLALTEIVGLPRERAAALMREVHEAGGAVVARLPRAEALACVAEVQARAAARGYPLRCSLEPT